MVGFFMFLDITSCLQILDQNGGN